MSDVKYEIWEEGSEGTRDDENGFVVVLKLRTIKRTNSVWVEAVDADGHKIEDGLLVGFMPNGKLRRGHGTNDEIGLDLTPYGLLKLDNKDADYSVSDTSE